jgi:hypothetical protein
MGVSWGEFGVLYAAALAGAACLTPYVLRLIRSSTRPVKMSPAVAAAAGFAQNAVLFAIVVFAGLAAAHAVGLGAPYVGALTGGAAPARPLAQAMAVGLGGGVAAGLFLTGADLVLLPRMPKLLELARRSTLLENFLASFYGGINEEFLTRLLGVSGLVWLIGLVDRARPAPDWAVWTAIVVMAVLFGLGHLPATKAVAGKITGLILLRALALNGPIAILCGWLFWRYGVEAAILAHFSADIVYHVGGTALLQANDRRRFLAWFPPASNSNTIH